jgi:predicted O-methyltransferase YrrM
MQTAPEQGQFMAMLVKLLGVRRYLEIGVYTGYSLIATTMALPDDGKGVALDRDERTMAVAEQYAERAGLLERIDFRQGPAMESLEDVCKDYGLDSFDLAFIGTKGNSHRKHAAGMPPCRCLALFNADADKRQYKQYFEKVLQLMRPGGLILIDNVLWYGKVADEAVTDKATEALRALNDDLLTDSRIDFSMIPVGDGIALCRKIP